MSKATSTGQSPAAREKRHLCRNCLAAVQGAFCAQCGQKQHSPIRHFSQVIGELFNDILNFDAKLLNTMKPLMLQPGFLSREYFDGRRARYVSPLKLYFFLSIVAFFLIQQSIDIAVENQGTQNVDAAGAGKDSDFHIGNFNGKPWHAKTNPMNVAWLPDAGNDLINGKLGKLESTVKNKDWQQLTHAALAATPQTLLILLPIFALLLKLVYLGRGKRYPARPQRYAEHLVYSAHLHSFAAVMLMAIVLSPWSGLGSLLVLWLVFYVLRARHVVYGGRWWAGLLRTAFVATCYAVLVSFAMLGLLAAAVMLR